MVCALLIRSLVKLPVGPLIVAELICSLVMEVVCSLVVESVSPPVVKVGTMVEEVVCWVMVDFPLVVESCSAVTVKFGDFEVLSATVVGENVVENPSVVASWCLVELNSVVLEGMSVDPVNVACISAEVVE